MIITLFVEVLFLQILFAQASPDYSGGLKIKHDEEGKIIFV
jgi:hypothetical protein